MNRLYIIPMELGPSSKGPAKQPKYLREFPGLAWGVITYGSDMLGLVMARDIKQAIHDQLILHPDVLAFPEDLDTVIGGIEAAAIDSYLDSRMVPADWVFPGTTYRQLARMVAGAFLYAQRYAGVSGHKTLFTSKIRMDTKFKQLSERRRKDMIEAAASMGFDPSPLTGVSTMSQMVNAMAEQWQEREIRVAGIKI